MAVGFLVHMKSTRVSKMFQRNKSRQRWSPAIVTVYIHNMIVRDFCTDNKSRFDDITRTKDGVLDTMTPFKLG